MHDDLPPDPNKFLQIGSTGLRRTGGFVHEDFLPKLQGLTGARTYTEMAENDPILGGMLFAITMLLRQTPWRVEAKDDSRAAKEAQELVQTVLFEKLTSSFSDVLSEVCSMFTYGYAPLEIVWARDDQKNIIPRKLALRSQQSVYRWAFDEAKDRGAVLGFWQMDPSAPSANPFLPITRLLLFRTEARLNNPEGRSILRHCYVPWTRKKQIEEAEGRAALRAAGVVELRIPARLMSTSASEDERLMFEAFKTMLTHLATDRQGGIILPSDVDPETKVPAYEFKYVLADGKRQADMSPLVERIDKRMAGSVLADFMLLGQQATGSFALSSDKTSLFTLAISAWNKVIAGPFNRDLLPRWWALNGWDLATMPTLVPGDIEGPDLGQLAAYIGALASAGAPLFPDPELEKYLRRQANLPEVAGPEAQPIAGPNSVPEEPGADDPFAADDE